MSEFDRQTPQDLIRQLQKNLGISETGEWTPETNAAVRNHLLNLQEQGVAAGIYDPSQLQQGATYNPAQSIEEVIQAYPDQTEKWTNIDHALRQLHESGALGKLYNPNELNKHSGQERDSGTIWQNPDAVQPAGKIDTGTNWKNPDAVEPSPGFSQGGNLSDYGEAGPGFTPEMPAASSEDHNKAAVQEGSRTLENGVVLRGETPPSVEWKMINKWPEVDCDIISPHFNGMCKYDAALDKSSWKNPDLAEHGPQTENSNRVNPDDVPKGPGTFGVGGGA